MVTIEVFNTRINEALRLCRWACFARRQNGLRAISTEMCKKCGCTQRDIVHDVICAMIKRLTAKPVNCAFTTFVVMSCEYTLMSMRKKCRIVHESARRFDVIIDQCGAMQGLELCESTKLAREVVQCLPFRFQQVIKLRFGLDGIEALDCRSVSKMFGVSGERIRQIEKRAIDMCRSEMRQRSFRAP